MQTRVAVVDADGHVMETDDELFEYLPPPYKGNLGVRVQSGFFPSIDGWNRSAAATRLRVLHAGREFLAYRIR